MQMRSLTAKLIVALAVSLTLSGCQPSAPISNSNSNTNSTPPTRATPAPDNNKRQSTTGASSGAGQASWALLDGRRTRLADYTGRVLVLDFWATYCPPCVAEAPHLAELQRRYEKQGLTVVGLNVGGADDQPKIPDFIQQTKVQYDIGFPDGALVESLMGSDDSIPQTFVFDRRGQLVKSFVGFDPATAGDIERAIQAALSAR